MHDFLQPDRPDHLWRKVSRFIEPVGSEVPLLARASSGARRVARGAVVQRMGARVRSMQVVQCGAFLEQRVTRDGRRQIQRVILPGDLIGTHDLALTTHTADVHAITDAEVVDLPRSIVSQSADTRLARLFYAFRMVEQAILADRMQTVARADGETRLLHFLLETNARQRLTCPMVDDAVWLPLTQSDVGDALGLTNVYVSKLMGALRRRGTIEIKNDMVRFDDRLGLTEMLGFEDRYASIDPEWLMPNPDSRGEHADGAVLVAGE